jgi:hypothetical protein
MAPRKTTRTGRSSEVASPPATPLLSSRIKSNRELQTIREMLGSKNSEWGATCIWHARTPWDTLPVTAQPFFLFSIFAGMVSPFSSFLLAILLTYGIQVIHLHPKSVALLAVLAYAYEAWIGIKPSVAYFHHLFYLRPYGLNQSSGCVSFITTARTEGDFIDLKWMKKVEDFWTAGSSSTSSRNPRSSSSPGCPPSSSPPGPVRRSLKRP